MSIAVAPAATTLPGSVKLLCDLCEPGFKQVVLNTKLGHLVRLGQRLWFLDDRCLGF
jgi:hypothetical protein